MSNVTDPSESRAQSLASDGLSAHQQGDLARAEEKYVAAIAENPDYFSALHLLGIVYIQTGRAEQGVEILSRALRIDPANLAALGDLSTALIGLRRDSEALDICEIAIGIDPAFGVAQGNRAAALHQLGRHDDALQGYRLHASLAPTDARPIFNAGVVAGHLRRFEEAVACFDGALAINPGYAAAHRSRGIMLRALQRPNDAVESLARAIALGAATAENYCDLGAALLDMGRASEALAALEQAIALNPAHVEAYSNRGVALCEFERFEEALQSFEQALALNPDCKSALCNQVAALLEMRRPGDALESCDRAIRLDPDYADAHHNRAAALYALRDLDRAIESCDAAIRLAPRFADAFKARGIAFHELGHGDKAIADLEVALALKPEDADTHYNLGMFRLARGEDTAGWRHYEQRWATPQFRKMRRDFPQPLWDGQTEIAGKTLMIYAEQGLGDTLQFCRYVPLVAALGADVIFEVQPGLERLVSFHAGAVRLVTRGAVLPTFDLQVPLMSLPHVLGAPPRGDLCPYLGVDPSWVAARGGLFPPRRGLRVGLCWAGGLRPNDRITNAVDARRSFTLDVFAPLSRLSGVDFFSLQMGPSSSQLHDAAARGWAGPPIIDLTPHITDFADTATLVLNMDLVISCDTSTAHLAGALDVPVWILNRFDPCWRWRDGQGDTAWYPSARLFKQSRPGDWTDTLEDVTTRLAERCKLGR